MPNNRSFAQIRAQRRGSQFIVGDGGHFRSIREATDYLKRQSYVDDVPNITGTLNTVTNGDRYLNFTGGNLWTTLGGGNSGSSESHADYVWSPDGGFTWYRILTVIDENRLLLAHPYNGGTITGGSSTTFGRARRLALKVLKGTYTEGIDLSSAANNEAYFIDVELEPHALINGYSTPDSGGSARAGLWLPMSGIVTVRGGVWRLPVNFGYQSTFTNVECYLDNIDMDSLGVDVIGGYWVDLGIFRCRNSRLQSMQDCIAVTTNASGIAGDETRFALFDNCDILNIEKEIAAGVHAGVRTFFGGDVRVTNSRVICSNDGGAGGNKAVCIDIQKSHRVELINTDVLMNGAGDGSGSIVNTWAAGLATAAQIVIHGGTMHVTAGDSFVAPQVYTGSGSLDLVSLDKNAIPLGGGGTFTITEHNTW